MKFLLDVNASGAVKEWLATKGHDLKLVRDKDIRMSDDNILRWANEEKRIIVTTDKDFEAMVWKENRNHSGILRLANVPRKERLNLLIKVMSEYDWMLQKRAIIIAKRNKIRVRHGR